MALSDRRKKRIGEKILDLPDEIESLVSSLTDQYRIVTATPAGIACLMQAVDTPARIRAGLDYKVAAYNANHGAGAAQAVISNCLAIAQQGVATPVTLADLSGQVAAMESFSSSIVAQVAGGMSWDEVADAINQQYPPDDLFDLLTWIEVPPGYVTVWGTPF